MPATAPPAWQGERLGKPWGKWASPSATAFTWGLSPTGGPRQLQHMGVTWGTGPPCGTRAGHFSARGSQEVPELLLHFKPCTTPAARSGGTEGWCRGKDDAVIHHGTRASLTWKPQGLETSRLGSRLQHCPQMVFEMAGARRGSVQGCRQVKQARGA